MQFQRIRLYGAIRFLGLSLFLLFFINFSKACEICGCSANGYHFGILPQYHQNFLGVKAHYRSFLSQHLASEAPLVLGEKAQETFYSIELWGRWNIGKKWQLIGVLPYNHFREQTGAVGRSATGIGDIVLMANYSLLDNSARTGQRFRQQLQAGAGLKLPTGRFREGGDPEALNPSLNTGTGSVDYLSNLNYTIRYRRVGLSTEASYRINGSNRQAFKYGSRANAGLNFFYWYDINKKHTLMPVAGLQWERAARDRHKGDLLEFTGGHACHLNAGLQWYSGRININFGYETPLQQSLSAGLVKTKNSGTLQVNYII